MNDDLDSLAIHLAKRVFPVPGGPNKRIPLSLCLSPDIFSKNYSLKFSIPPISDHLTEGISMS